MEGEGGGGTGGGPPLEEEVRTLFISGLPSDTKEREIHNLFCSHSGYQGCHIKFTGRGYQIVAFAMFADQASALAAKDAFNGHIFDPELGSTLIIELAKSNSRVKRPHSDERGPSSSEKRIRGVQGLSGFYPEAAGMGHTAYDLSGFPPPSQSGMLGTYTVQDGTSAMMMGSTVPPPPLPTRGSIQPCTTLFISNLGHRCTEEELKQVIGRFPGFRKLKMQMRGGLPVAFVEFEDPSCSTQAMNQLQNFLLPSSEYGSISVEYAKSRMGQPGRQMQRQLAELGRFSH